MNWMRFGQRSLALLFGAVVLAACEGENLFDNDQNPFIVPRVSVGTPAFAFAGDSVAVAITGEAARGVQLVELTLRGAVNKDTAFAVSGLFTANTVFIELPNALTDTVLFASVRIVDLAGNRSLASVDTIRLFGPTAPTTAPVVTSLTGQDTSRVGRIYDVRAAAQGPLPIVSLIFRFRGAANRTIEVAVPASTSVVADAEVSLDVAESFVTVQVVAKDINGAISALTASAFKQVQVFPKLTP